MNLPNIRRALADYHGPPLTFMEICGTHTAADTHCYKTIFFICAF